MPIERLRARDLSEGERAGLEAALRDPVRFHSDGKAVTIACGILPLLLAPLEVVLLYEAHGTYTVYGNPLHMFEGFWAGFPWSLSILWHPNFLEIAGCIALPLALVAILAYGWRTYGRHGYAVTSFGVVRIRGDALQVLRYADLEETGISERNYPLHRIITDELELKAKGGGSLVLYGFRLEEFREQIDRLRRHSLDSDRKKG
jgi:hypothetical protein